jgi:hypothetical protein
MAWSVDRLGRSLQDLVAFLAELHALGVDLFLHQQGLDTTTPAGKAMFQMMGVFAEVERAMIQERVRAGLRRARDEGKQLGRPKIDADVERAILGDLRRKHRPGMRVIAATHGVSVNTVQRIAHVAPIARIRRHSQPEPLPVSHGRRSARSSLPPGGCTLAMPLGTPHMQLAGRNVDIIPAQRHQLAGAQYPDRPRLSFSPAHLPANRSRKRVASVDPSSTALSYHPRA